ncbi:DUF4174 domain-containing protein [Pistricoccus aurantiacus]|uniref:DUF4174 domain-containing protein n=1 Tax=Pistricoccus aurantiacus TaxID=1883414 RepID=UPI00363704AD
MWLRLWSILLLTGGLMGTGIAQEGGVNPAANPLITDQGKFRPLILVTPSAENADYQRMLADIQRQRASLEERRMLLYRIEDSEGWREDKPMTAPETRALLEALELDAQGPLQVVLVGLDGGKKMQLEGHVELQEIFRTIDNMPMRRAQMKHQNESPR